MYYIIEKIYVGPNQDQERYIDAVEIRNTPAVTNTTHEKQVEGWCGTTNDWSITAHGEYSSIEEAREAITEKFGEVRKLDADHDHATETYKLGKYEQLSAEATAGLCHESIQLEIDATTTDAQIDALLAEYEADLNSEGYSPHSELKGFMQARRQELRDEVAND